MYKVFVNQTPIVLTDHIGVFTIDEWEVVYYTHPGQLFQIVSDFMMGKRRKSIYVTHFDIDELWHAFICAFKYVQASGGMVFNADNDFIAIHRNGRWDLPKGHLKKGEQPIFGGMREVEEECGVSDLRVIKPLDCTFHMYERNGIVLKKTFWFLMRSYASVALTPLIEEGIDCVEWKNKNDIAEMDKSAYPLVRELWKKGFEIINR